MKKIGIATLYELCRTSYNQEEKYSTERSNVENGIRRDRLDQSTSVHHVMHLSLAHFVVGLLHVYTTELLISAFNSVIGWYVLMCTLIRAIFYFKF